jgi:hypothetical protein
VVILQYSELRGKAGFEFRVGSRRSSSNGASHGQTGSHRITTDGFSWQTVRAVPPESRQMFQSCQSRGCMSFSRSLPPRARWIRTFCVRKPMGFANCTSFADAHGYPFGLTETLCAKVRATESRCNAIAARKFLVAWSSVDQGGFYAEFHSPLVGLLKPVATTKQNGLYG